MVALMRRVSADRLPCAAALEHSSRFCMFRSADTEDIIHIGDHASQVRGAQDPNTTEDRGDALRGGR